MIATTPQRYSAVPVAESERLNFTISEEVIEAVRDFLRAHSPLSKQAFWYGAIRCLMEDWIAAELYMSSGGRRAIKPAGERFLRRTHDLPTGAPPDFRAEDRGALGRVSVRLPPQLAEDLRDAVFWQLDQVGSVSYAVEEAARLHMKRSIEEVMSY